MRNFKIIGGLGVLALAAAIGLQIASIQLDDAELREDLRDVVAQNGARIGLTSPKTDDEIRSELISAAAEQGLRLKPEQVTVRHAEYLGRFPHLYVSVDYDARVNLLVYSYPIHFSHSADR